MVENRREVVDNLRQQAKLLQAENLDVIQNDAMKFLAQAKDKYHVVFIDPPFDLELHEKVCQLLLDTDCLQERALVYLESDGNIPVLSGFDVYKQNRAGAVNFALLRPGQEKSKKQ